MSQSTYFQTLTNNHNAELLSNDGVFRRMSVKVVGTVANVADTTYNVTAIASVASFDAFISYMADGRADAIKRDTAENNSAMFEKLQAIELANAIKAAQEGATL
jgi:acylphosphatase